LIQSYLPELIQMLEQDASPATICATIGACNASVLVVPPPAPESAGFCSVCELLFTYVESILSGNATEYEIEKVLDDVCNILPAALRSECESLIQSYLPELIELLLNKESPAGICDAIHACSNMTVAAAPAPQGVFCVACEYAIQTLESFVSEQSTEQEIVVLVENVCQLAPANVQSICDDMIATYGPEVINLLISKATPDTVCTLAGACADEVRAPRGGLCPICEFVVSSAESWLEQSQSEQDLEGFIDHLCSLLPGSSSSECDTMVAAFLPMLVQFVESNVTPTAACTAINVC
jgi:saposin